MSDVLILDIPTIPGSSQLADPAYSGKIKVDSYLLGAYQGMTSDPNNSQRVEGAVRINDMSFSKSSDLATSGLYTHCVTAKKIEKATLYVGRMDDNKFVATWTYVMENVFVSEISSSGGSGMGSDNFSLNFSKIKAEFKKQAVPGDQAGTATWNYDRSQGKAN